jgi:hypothetical protein
VDRTVFIRLLSSMKRQMRLLSFLCAALAACGSGSSPGKLSDLSGNWTGVLTSDTAPNTETVDLFVTQSGSSLNGPRMFLNTGAQQLVLCDSAGTMNGTFAGGQAKVTLVVPVNPTLANLNQTVTLEGTVSGNSVSGTYLATSGCLSGDKGSFQLSLASSIGSTQWTGTWNGPFGSGGSASASLSQDSNAVVGGTLTLAGSPCDSIGADAQTVSGTMTGLSVQLGPPSLAAGRDFGGILSADGRSLTLVHSCHSQFERALNVNLHQ